MKLVFNCPSCRKQNDWPKSLTGELAPKWHCSGCGASGEIASDAFELIVGLLESKIAGEPEDGID